MTPRTILEIASKFCYDGERAIAFDQRLEIDREALVDFAEAVIEADRESSDEPVAWAYITKDCKIVHYEFVEGLVPLYRRPSLARKPLSDEEILRVATKSPPFIPWLLQEGVTLGDVRGMAVDFARRIEKAHGIGESE